MGSSSNKYALAHSSPSDAALDWIEKQTNIRTNYPQMLSGPVTGGFLKMLVQLTGAVRVLEVGTFSGYSAVCMARGLKTGGHIDTLEINDEMEDLIREGWERAGVSDRITLHVGDALESLRSFAPESFDIVFIDANKRQYADYYRLCLPLLRHGGLIVADDVMQGGKVFSDPPAADPQTAGLLKFNDLVRSDDGVDVVMLPLPDGLSLIRKK